MSKWSSKGSTCSCGAIPLEIAKCILFDQDNLIRTDLVVVQIVQARQNLNDRFVFTSGETSRQRRVNRTSEMWDKSLYLVDQLDRVLLAYTLGIECDIHENVSASPIAIATIKAHRMTGMHGQ